MIQREGKESGGVEAAKRFEDLWIWQQARALVGEIYRDFGVDSLARRDFGFRDQIQRAGISVMNNIAEGFERNTNADFARLLDIARGSAGEVRSMYFAAEDLGYVPGEIADSRRQRGRKISAGIASLSKHLRASS